MDETARRELEANVKSRCESGDFDGAATLALRGYGKEIYGFLIAIQKSEEHASDVFSIFSESFWRGLPKFSWECTLRAWAYTIARHAAYRHRKNERRRASGRVGLSQDDAIGAIVQHVRTETREWMRTEQKDKFTALRDSLDPEDKELLILRVDRGLAFEEIARIMLSADQPEEDAAGEGEEPSADAIKKESARLRKRFQLVKEKLVTLGKKAGLIKPKE